MGKSRDLIAGEDDLKYRELSEELGQEQALTALQQLSLVPMK